MLAFFFTFLLTFSSTEATDGGGILWQSDYAAAFALAQERDTIVFLAVNMDGENANDMAAKKLYHDATIEALASGTVSIIASRFEHTKSGACPRFGTISCAEHQKIDIKARAAVFNPEGDAEVIAPHHVFLDKDGKILLSVAYAVQDVELAWCFVTAQRLAYPNREIEFSKGARAPKRLLMGEVAKGAGGAARPLTLEELEKTIDELNSAPRIEDRARLVYMLLATDHPDAIKAVERELINAGAGGGRGGRGGGGGNPEDLLRITKGKQDLIHRIGIFSPASYWEALLPQLNDVEPLTRQEAAVGLEQLAVPESLKELRKVYKKEEDPHVRRAIVRAMGTAGAGDTSTRKTLIALAKSKKEQSLQLNAIFAVANQGAGKDVRKLFEEILAGSEVGPPQAAVLGIAFARNESLKDLLDGFPTEQGELSKDLWECVEAAREVFAGGNLSLLRSAIERVCGDTIARERYFGTTEA
jgi:hypothetical protein